jgi:mucin-19
MSDRRRSSAAVQIHRSDTRRIAPATTNTPLAQTLHFVSLSGAARRRALPALLAGVSLAALLTGVVPAAARNGAALPSGGTFVAGAGAISQSGNVLTITQSSLRGIIDWSRFSIGGQSLVQFESDAGATLNRVTGGEMSRLNGTLAATGSVYLINPAGVLVGKGGTINTDGSFVASTLDVTNDAFIAGGTLVFAGSSAASVQNKGTVTAGGDVFLIARTVENDGSMAAPNGTAGLAAGQQVLLQDTSSDQRIFIEASGGNVTNTGTITAAEAELKAAGGNVYALAGNNGGMISATGTTIRGGHVWLTATDGGSVSVSGNISAQNADGSGGAVDVAGDGASGTAIRTAMPQAPTTVRSRSAAAPSPWPVSAASISGAAARSSPPAITARWRLKRRSPSMRRASAAAR